MSNSDGTDAVKSSELSKDIQEIFEFLPHRYPFLLVDRVLDVVVGESIRGYKNITINEGVFEGHFPGKPIFPGVMIVEAVAQLAGVLAFETKNTRPAHGPLFFLSGVDKARFKKPVVPGDQLMMEARLLANRSRLMKFECRAEVDGVLACGCEIMIMHGDV